MNLTQPAKMKKVPERRMITNSWYVIRLFIRIWFGIFRKVRSDILKALLFIYNQRFYYCLFNPLDTSTKTMGIKGLSKLLADVAPSCMKENDIKAYFGRKVAIDASMSIYQFLIAVRQDGNVLMNDQGETTSHLLGLFYRTIRIMDNGIKPVYVFDGKPPNLKGGELQKRGERREEAKKELAKAEETGDVEAIDKFQRRLVKVTPEHNDECKKLLRLMGVPYIEAPCEAEAQCAHLVKTGKVYAAGTEDMDALTFGSTVLLRHLTFSEMKKAPIQEFHLNRVLSEMNFTMKEFVDLCIMLGCDYCDTIRGIGPKKSIDLIRTHKSIENVLEAIDQEKYPPPENWMYKEARELFFKAEVDEKAGDDLKWNDPDENALIEFLCVEKGFSEDRVRSGAKKIMKAKGAAVQSRLDSFFTASPVTRPPLNVKNEKMNPAKRLKTEKTPTASKKSTAKKGAAKRK